MIVIFRNNANKVATPQHIDKEENFQLYHERRLSCGFYRPHMVSHLFLALDFFYFQQ